MTWNWLGKGRRVPSAFQEPSPAPMETLGDAALASRISSIRVALIEGRLDDASLETEQLWRSNPSSEEALTLRGICCYLGGDIGAATSLLRAAVERNATNAEAFKFLAACLEAQRDDKAAVSINRIAAELNPADTQVLCVAAALHTRLGNFDEAALLLNQAIKVEPDSLLVLNGFEVLSSRSTYKRTMYEVGPKPAEARTRAERRLLAEHRKNGLSAESLAMLLGFLAADQPSFQRALKLALASIKFEPMTAALAEQIASVFWLAGMADQMLSLRVLAHDLDGNDPTARLALGHARLMTGHPDWLGTWRVMTDALINRHPEVHPQQIPTWRGERLGRGKLLVYQDQGVGDAIMAMRFVSLLAARGIEFDLWVVPSLVRLARDVVRPARVLEAPKLPDGAASDYAYAVPLFGLISALGIDRAELAVVAPLEIDAGHAPHLRPWCERMPLVKESD
jgi:tetratricopeptide (TPR) repeat protein